MYGARAKKRKLLEETCRRLSDDSDKPAIESFSSDSDDLEEMKNFNVTLPRYKKKIQHRTNTSVKSKSKLTFLKTPVTDKNRQMNESLKKKRLFEDSPKPGTSKEKPNIEDFSSDDDFLDNILNKRAKTPEIEDFDDVDDEISKSPVILPCSSTSEESQSSHINISQASSEQLSQMHRFNTVNTYKVKVKPGGYVEQLLKAISEAQQENLQWDTDTNTPSSQTQYFTVSHFENVRGSMMIFFTIDNQKCAIFLDPKDKIVKKLKVGAMFAFCPDHNPYEVDGDVKVYVGLTKLKFIH